MMKKITIFTVLLTTVMHSFAQINFEDVAVEEWLGEGSHSAMFIIDFDSDAMGSDSSFAWGINFETDSISGENILDMISNSDQNFTYTSAGGFLNNVIYYDNDQSYTNPNPTWFAMFESMDGLTWDWNLGLSDHVGNNQWFGIVCMNPDTYEAEINVPLLTLLPEQLQSIQFSVFPNPATDFISINASAPAEISIYDAHGILLYQSFTQNEKIDLSDYRKGFYLLSLKNPTGLLTKKIIIQ